VKYRTWFDILSKVTATIDPPTLLTRPPWLANGDRLTADEFERRYVAMPDVNKAQLIEGFVHMPSPVRLEDHAQPHAAIVGILYLYSASTPGVSVADNVTVRLDEKNRPQPDAILRINEQNNGRSTRTTDDYLQGVPELAVEIAGTTTAVDLGEKYRAYERAGVPEYLVWLTYDRDIRLYKLQRGQFVVSPPDDAGVLRSSVFPGLWLDTRAMINRDLAMQVAVLQQGLGSPEHHAFVKSLASTIR
jgi:Uma2 family endonuclease